MATASELSEAVALGFSRLPIEAVGEIVDSPNPYPANSSEIAEKPLRTTVLAEPFPGTMSLLRIGAECPLWWHYLYPDTEITAWGGPGQGTVSNIIGSEWRPYLQTANHPEYPSASASFCRAHATATKLYLEEIIGLLPTAANDLSYWTPDIPIAGAPLAVPAGGSIIEPGVTPAVDTTLGWDTWDEFSEECGISRLWAGVHFFDSIPAGQAIGDPIGAEAFDWLNAHIEGKAN